MGLWRPTWRSWHSTPCRLRRNSTVSEPTCLRDCRGMWPGTDTGKHFQSVWVWKTFFFFFNLPLTWQILVLHFCLCIFSHHCLHFVVLFRRTLKWCFLTHYFWFYVCDPSRCLAQICTGTQTLASLSRLIWGLIYSLFRYVCIAMEALDQLLMACHCQSINLFVESFLKMVRKLLESDKPSLQILGTNSVSRAQCRIWA